MRFTLTNSPKSRTSAPQYPQSANWFSKTQFSLDVFDKHHQRKDSLCLGANPEYLCEFLSARILPWFWHKGDQYRGSNQAPPFARWEHGLYRRNGDKASLSVGLRIRSCADASFARFR